MKQKFIEWFIKKNNGCTPARADDGSFEREKTQHMFEAYQAGVAEGEARCAALAAENALLKKSEPAPFSKLMMEALDVYQAGAEDVPELAMLSAYKKLRDGLKTPATDAFLAEVRAQARNEGINYAASRLAAAYNNGFIGKSMSEVADVVHMILDAKTELANSIIPPADGLSGEYAEKSLAEFAAQLRKGAKL